MKERTIRSHCEKGILATYRINGKIFLETEEVKCIRQLKISWRNRQKREREIERMMRKKDGEIF